jgi:sec-independent protein translocase protein TatC
MPSQPEKRAAGSESDDPTEKMSFFDHLAELRMRILYSLVAVAAGLCVGLYYAPEAYAYLAEPMLEALRAGGFAERLVNTSPLGVLQLYITVGLYLGIVIASPMVFYQLWKFVAPGLYKHERKAAMTFLISSVTLFLAGTAFGYRILLPMTLEFLVALQKNSIFTPMISINEYFSMVLVILLGLGVVFQLPVLVFVLSVFGIVTPGFLWRNFRYAVLLIAMAAAIITPTTDVLTMSIFMAPMLALYLLGIAVSAAVVRRKRLAAEQRAATM